MNTYPVNLMLENRDCLIVGGGKVAVRKLERLLESRAAVTLIAPKANQQIERLASDGRISLIQRSFRDSDLEGVCLVFAAADDTSLNKYIIDLCMDRNILVCAVDDNWHNGAFITPASFRKNDITIAVSSQGKACRQTRMIKESLARHIETIESAELMIMGTDHNYMSIAEREPLHMVGSKDNDSASLLMNIWGVHEFMILNTCNRIELIAVVSKKIGVETLLRRVMGFDRKDDSHFYIKYGLEAFGHLAEVCAGLLSQTPGENHITAQLKSAYSIAEKANWAGYMLREWLDSTLHVSKHIRTATDPLLRHIEVEDLAFEYLNSKYDNLAEQKILLIGTGVIGKALLHHFSKVKTSIYWCYHKNRPELPEESSSSTSLCSFNEIRDALPLADIVISAVNSPLPVIHHGHTPFMNTQNDITLIDLAIPRNISPELEKVLPNAELLNLDDLKYWHRRKNCDMAKLYSISKEIIYEHNSMYEKIIYSFQGGNKEE